MEKGIALLSGGIDSPVAIHLMKDRLDVVAVHFHQLPLTDEKEVEKVKDLVKLLGVKKVYLIPFVDVLKALVEKCNHGNYFILGKIVMMKCSEIIANREGAKFLITGENLAQVSSQTLSNLKTITSFLDLEIFRPVLTYDKQEIIKVAKDINTYEISKGPEICNLLGPKSPKTKSNKEKIAMELEKLDLAALFNDAISKADIIEV
jgi:tRNA uracil 4-sulfurtransferase